MLFRSEYMFAADFSSGLSEKIRGTFMSLNDMDGRFLRRSAIFSLIWFPAAEHVHVRQMFAVTFQDDNVAIRKIHNYHHFL